MSICHVIDEIHWVLWLGLTNPKWNGDFASHLVVCRKLLILMSNCQQWEKSVKSVNSEKSVWCCFTLSSPSGSLLSCPLHCTCFIMIRLLSKLQYLWYLQYIPPVALPWPLVLVLLVCHSMLCQINQFQGSLALEILLPSTLIPLQLSQGLPRDNFKWLEDWFCCRWGLFIHSSWGPISVIRSRRHGRAWISKQLTAYQSSSLYIAIPVRFSRGWFDDVLIRPDRIIPCTLWQ
jgi:hypothetical protein